MLSESLEAMMTTDELKTWSGSLPAKKGVTKELQHLIMYHAACYELKITALWTGDLMSATKHGAELADTERMITLLLNKRYECTNS